MDWTYGHRVVRTLFSGAQYYGIANTIVQLIRRSTSGVIRPSQPIRSDSEPQRYCFSTTPAAGSRTFTDDEMNEKLSAATGDASPAPMRFFSYKDPEENTREQIKRVRSHPWIAKDVPVRGFIFDVDTGRLREVKVLEHERAA